MEIAIQDVCTSDGRIGKKIAIKDEELSSVVERLIKVDKWKKKHALMAVEQYKNYIYLRAKYPEKDLPPSKEIDEVWHAHILHTKDYFAFCERIFGCYLHHHPHVANAGYSVEKLRGMFDETQELYKEEFGTYINKVKRFILVEVLLWVFGRGLLNQ